LWLIGFRGFRSIIVEQVVKEREREREREYDIVLTNFLLQLFHQSPVYLDGGAHI
jgi:hypothetical protein